MNIDVQQRISAYNELGFVAFERSGLIMTTLTGAQDCLQVVFIHPKHAGLVVSELDRRGIAVPIMMYEGSPWWAFLVTVDADVEECVRRDTDWVFVLPPVSTVALPTPGRRKAHWIRMPQGRIPPPMSVVLGVADDLFRVYEAGGQK
ncbi:hypothetical protein GZH49_25840 [Nocardia terpenica]|uniref:hypothetical protein n=1 Tax=Nocardia terpenica TaxID=455432 RepID=UPI002FE0B850